MAKGAIDDLRQQPHHYVVYMVLRRSAAVTTTPLRGICGVTTICCSNEEWGAWG